MHNAPPLASSAPNRRPAVTVLAALGPNPAPLAELVWALARQRGLYVESLYLVVDQEGERFLRGELLAGGAALDELIDCLGLPLSRARVHCRVVHGPDDTPLDDEYPAHAEHYNAAIWDSARDAIAHAAELPVVFALVAGRRRTMTAMSTMAFQLLARPQDACIDVRVSERAAEGGSGFFFPEQRRQRLVSPAGWAFTAADVEVRLIDVQLPRLRGLLGDEALRTHAAALSAGQAAIDAAEPPALRLDISRGEAWVDGEPLPLSTSEFIWYLTLAEARRAGQAWVAVNDIAMLRATVHRCAPHVWTETVKNRTLRAWLEDKPSAAKSTKEVATDLNKLRADTRNRLEKWCVGDRTPWQRWLRPQTHKSKPDKTLVYVQGIPLNPERIDIMDEPAA